MAAAAVFVAFAAAGAAEAQGPGIDARFPSIAADDRIAQSFRPASIAGGRRIQVVVLMSADSVATARAKVANHKIAAAARGIVEKQADAQQAAIKPLLEAKGARVVAQFHSALNGIKVEVERSKLAALAAMPGVVAVLPVGVYRPHNVVGVPFIGAPAVWQGVPGFRGEGVKIAVIDTGIDYTHANFGGPGTVAAFDAASATSTLPANPALFGPAAPKVKGGTDLVGDDYDADPNNPTYQPVPHPDPNPLDCNGHGSHVAGTATGYGVLGGRTYEGPYTAAAYAQQFDIGPGVAPRADLYSVRVFGCNGSSDVVTEAIDWAVAHDVDIINMSLGADWNDKDTSDAVASQNAILAGITVVASSGNAGSAPYITGSPASGASVISVAAMDSSPGFPAANIALNSGVTVVAIDANNAAVPSATFPLVVLRNPDGSVSLGCNEAEYANTLVGGKTVVTVRGVCARVDRAVFGQRHGAAAVIMINTDAGYPPFENTIAGVTIPFLGVPSTGGPAVLAAASAALSSAGAIANPAFEAVASFSSAGPRYGDGQFKPNVAAPGVSTFSTLVGSGNGGEVLSGTSMAAPHVAGVAALVRQAHPGWSVLAQRAAVTQTANAAQMVGYLPRLAGTGVVQALPATRTQAIVLGSLELPDPLSFGFVELTSGNYFATRDLDIRNNGTSALRFSVSVAAGTGSAPHFVAPLSSSITVPPASDVMLPVKLSVPAATVGATHPLGTTSGFREVAGRLTLTPADAATNGGASLTIPYYLVPRVRSLVSVSHNVPSRTSPASTLTVSNGASAIAGTADFYAWGLTGTPQGMGYVDTRAVGVQSLALSSTDSLLVFAISTFSRISNAAPHEWDLIIDVDGDGAPDYIVFATDVSLIVPTQPAGRLAAAVYSVAADEITDVRFADAPTDGTTLLVPVLASALGLSPARPRFDYQLFAVNNFNGSTELLPGRASFNAFAPAVSTGMFVTVNPNQSAPVAVTINPAEWALTPSLGVMMVAQDNLTPAQADLIPIAP